MNKYTKSVLRAKELLEINDLIIWHYEKYYLSILYNCQKHVVDKNSCLQDILYFFMMIYVSFKPKTTVKE